MLRDLRTALARRRKRERLRRQYMAALSLDDRLLRDAGIRRDEVLAHIDALA